MPVRGNAQDVRITMNGIPRSRHDVKCAMRPERKVKRRMICLREGMWRLSISIVDGDFNNFFELVSWTLTVHNFEMMSIGLGGLVDGGAASRSYCSVF
eukprot:scaffold110267_cov24-Cyclotella_meneghiniana.AAC.1